MIVDYGKIINLFRPESKLMSFTEIASLDHKRFCF